MKRYIIILLAIPIVLQSCSSMYIPATRSIPLFEKKGEFQAEAGISTNSIYANSSYAFTDNFAASINGNLSYGNFSNRYDLFTHKKDEPPSDLWWPDTRGDFSHRYAEVSVGKINMLPTFPMRLEVFGGIGMGRATDIDHFNNDNRYKTDYYAFFGQGNFGFKKQLFEAGISIRLAYSYFNYTANIYSRDLYQREFGVIHAEPMLFARVGTERLKFVYRLGVNLALTMDPTEEYTGYNEYRGLHDQGKLSHTIFHISIGMSYRIGGK